MPLYVLKLSLCFSACLFIIILFEDLLSCGASRFGGAYDFIVKTLEPCPDANKYLLHYSSRLSKFNRTTVTYSSKIYTPYDFDDTWIADVNVAVLGNGGWKDNFYNLRLYNFCSTLTEIFPDVTVKMAAAIHQVKLCPGKAGTYDIKDFIVKTGPLHGFPSFPYGTYKFEVITQKSHENGTMELMACFRAGIDIKPKSKRQ